MVNGDARQIQSLQCAAASAVSVDFAWENAGAPARDLLFFAATDWQCAGQPPTAVYAKPDPGYGTLGFKRLNIAPSAWRTAIMRLTGADGRTRRQWENLLLPGRCAGSAAGRGHWRVYAFPEIRSFKACCSAGKISMQPVSEQRHLFTHNNFAAPDYPTGYVLLRVKLFGILSIDLHDEGVLAGRQSIYLTYSQPSFFPVSILSLQRELPESHRFHCFLPVTWQSCGVMVNFHSA